MPTYDACSDSGGGIPIPGEINLVDPPVTGTATLPDLPLSKDGDWTVTVNLNTDTRCVVHALIELVQNLSSDGLGVTTLGSTTATVTKDPQDFKVTVSSDTIDSAWLGLCDIPGLEVRITPTKVPAPGCAGCECIPEQLTFSVTSATDCPDLVGVSCTLTFDPDYGGGAGAWIGGGCQCLSEVQLLCPLSVDIQTITLQLDSDIYTLISCDPFMIEFTCLSDGQDFSPCCAPKNPRTVVVTISE